MTLQVDLNACLFGWGPCDGGWSHTCKKDDGHDGFHICVACGNRTKGVGVWRDEVEYQAERVVAEMVGPHRGPCGFCGDPDARHRVVDAANELLDAGEPWDVVVAEFGLASVAGKDT